MKDLSGVEGGNMNLESTVNKKFKYSEDCHGDAEYFSLYKRKIGKLFGLHTH